MPSSGNSFQSNPKLIGNKKNLLKQLDFSGSWEEFTQYCEGASRNVGEKYYVFDSVPKPSSPTELRTIDKPRWKLKQLQNKLHRFLKPRITFPECVHGSVRGKSYITNAQQHLRSEFFFLVDIEKFYPSVTMSMVYSALKTIIVPEIAEVLTKLTTLDGHLPTGSPISSFVSNVALRELDLQLQGLCQERGLVYTRYVDDLTISARWDFRRTDTSKHVLRFVHANGFRHKREKTHFAKGEAEITGVVVKRCRLLPTAKSLKKLRESQETGMDEARTKGLLQHVQSIKKANDERFISGQNLKSANKQR